MRIAAIVVTHNRLSALQKTLERLFGETPEDLSNIIVVDNASTDDTSSWLQSLSDPRLDVISSEHNLGGAGGFEIGLRHAINAHDPDWCVVMDDDASPRPGALATFRRAPRDNAEAWAAAVYDAAGKICDMNRPFLNPLWHKGKLARALRHGRNGFYLGAADYTASACTPIDGASFVGLFLSRSAIERAGYPDRALFIYGDDVLYTLGLSRAGGTILFDPTVQFDHDFKSQPFARGRFRPLWKAYYHHRNLAMIYRRLLGWRFWLVLPAIAAKWLFKIRHYEGERRAYLTLISHALWDGIRENTSLSHDTVLSMARPAYREL